jgi:hypothetical protein
LFYFLFFKKSLDLQHFFLKISQQCYEILHLEKKAACNQPLVEP